MDYKWFSVMDEPPRKIDVVFYQTETGHQVLLDWLRTMDSADRAIIGQGLMKVQFGWPVGIP